MKKNKHNGVASHGVVRVMAGSLVLSVVLSTLALHTARAQDANALTATTAAPQDVRMNVLPLRQLLQRAREMAARGELRLDTPVELNIEAERQADGSLTNVAVGVAQGSEQVSELAREFAAALDASRALSVFADAGHMTFRLRLDGARLVARLSTEIASEQRAAEMSRGYGGMLAIAARMKAGRPEATLYQNMRTSASGKQFALTLDMPREQAGNLILQLITPN